MQSNLAEHFRRTRIAKGIKLGQLARLIGYTNATKGANRIVKFERGGDVQSQLLLKVADVLDIDGQTIERLIDEDRRRFFEEWNAWANEPIRPHLVIRLLAAVYLTKKLPEDIQTVEEAEQYAGGMARHWHRKCCLVLSRRVSVWLSENGDIYNVSEAVPGEANHPVMYLGQKPCFVTPGLGFQQIVWPKKGEVK